MRFPGFLGNEEVKNALSSLFEAGRFPHAILITGAEGTGKLRLAKTLAKALVCRDRELAPCDSCPSCRRAEAGSHPDIRIYFPAGAGRSLTVDNILDLSEDSSRMPEEAEVSVYILVLGTKPSESMQNKLLKLIEEPPDSACFLLIAENTELLLPTVRSRVQNYTLFPPDEESAAREFSAKAGVPLKDAKELSKLFGGNLGRMKTAGKGGDALKTAVGIAEGLLSPRGEEVLRNTVPLLKDRALARETLLRLEMIFRDACILRLGGEAALSGAAETAEKLDRLPLKGLSTLPELMQDFIKKLDGNANLQLLLTAMCAKLRETVLET